METKRECEGDVCTIAIKSQLWVKSGWVFPLFPEAQHHPWGHIGLGEASLTHKMRPYSRPI